MKRNQGCLQRSRIAIAMALLGGLAACGGGGGGGPGPDASLVTISAANQDTVAHASAAALGVVSVSNAMPFSVPAGMAQPLAARAASTGFTPWAAWLPGHVTAVLLQRLAGAPASAAAVRPLSVYGPTAQACSLGGSMSVSWDDRNGNANPDVGDVISVDFSNCAEDAAGTVNGHVAATITGLTGSTSMSLSMAMSNLSTASVDHTLTIGGTMAVVVTTDASGNTAAMKMTADGAVTVNAHTHGFDDSVTLQSGFVQNAAFDAAGTSRVSFSGRIGSTAMAGATDVSTLAEFVSASTDAYPQSGAVRLAGKAGKLQLTVSGASVRMDLDSNDDGSFEATKTVAWDWLL